jgi:hypothetical protein
LNIRQKQVEEKSVLKKEEVEFESEWLALMQKDRVSALEVRKAKAERAKDKNLEFARALKVQIEEKRRQRIIEEELVEQEKQQMLANIIIQQEAAVEKAKKKVVEQRERSVELGEFNKQFISMKERKKQEEKDQDARIMQYIVDQQKKLEHRLAQEEKAKAEKEAETARLRAKQEKMLDLTAQEGMVP